MRLKGKSIGVFITEGFEALPEFCTELVAAFVEPDEHSKLMTQRLSLMR